MPEITPEALRAVHDRGRLFHFLHHSLGWPVEVDDAEEPFTYDARQPLGLEGAVRVSRIVPFGESDPFVLMLAEFQTPFRRTDLRRILQGIRQDDRVSQRYGGRSPEEIIFLCPTQNYAGVSFAHFEERAGRGARLAVFGWDGDRVGETRTVRQINLPALAMPGRNLLDEYDWTVGRASWLKAWDVKAVTGQFFAAYRDTFKALTEQVGGVPGGDTRLFTQRLLNRLLFIQFLSKRGWLRYGDRKDYLNALWEAWVASAGATNFYQQRLSVLFFAGLNNSQCRDLRRDNEVIYNLIGDVPFLNGGLFDRTPEDGSGENLPVVPNDAIRSVLDLFNEYNFTITESTPDDIEVAVDPEMLGEVFERLVTREERQGTGSYYTPRSIVQFMCREALKGHLGGYADVVDRDRQAIDALPQQEAVTLLQKLTSVRVLDPACGSGAYLLGMLHELFELVGLVEVRAYPLSEEDKYRRKLDIIQNNLYGVDLQEFAVETARLRLWLSLVVEDERNPLDDGSNVALPNLDFKIEDGDSLTAPSPHYTPDLIRDGQIREFQRLKGEYLRAHGGRKQTLWGQLDTLRGEIAASSHSGRRIDGFDWAVEFAEVFLEGGFDVVLANPPYGASVADAVRDQYFDRRVEGAQSKDTYGLFIARALQLLRPGGQFCYIISDTWRTIKSHRPLRRRLLGTTTVRHVLDLPSWIFDATVNTCILTLTKTSAAPEHTLIAGDLRPIAAGNWRDLEANLRAIAAHGVDVQTLEYARYTYLQNLIGTYDNCSFFISSPKIYSLMSHDEYRSLRSLDAKVKQGLITADNSYYLRKRHGVRGSLEILDEQYLLSDAEIEALSDQERLRGVNPEDYNERHYVPYDKGGESNSSEGWMPNYYVPTQYFIDWSTTAVHRLETQTSEKQAGRIAARLQNRTFYFQPGITFSPTGEYSPSFRLGCAAVFGNKGSTIFCSNIDTRVLLGLMASILGRYLLKTYLSHTVETGEEVMLQFVLPPLTVELERAINTLVSQVIEHQRANPRYPYHLHEQKEIDALIYQLYGLNEDDIREVELWYCRRYPRLAAAQGVTAEAQTRYAGHLAHAAIVMSRPASYWNSHPVLRLIAQGESQRLEFKQTLEADATTGLTHPGVLQSALKTIAAFANTDGGTLLIGVHDRGDITGLAQDYTLFRNNQGNADALEQKLRSLFHTRFTPNPHGNIAIEIHTLPAGQVCEISVRPVDATEVVHLDTRDVYIRDGNGSRKLEGPALTRWLVQRGQQGRPG